ncbi:MAG TPA: 4-phospho-D-threonate 3-dehydrogenase, partial [Dehalococcoidia bacterium]|nr:4-phospho-D-threonate 3-dehydrogenase [Dehalococcoidia bacterium]
MTAERPVIALTMGDAAGIGPEVIVKALQSRHVYGVARPLVLGSRTIMQDAIDLVNGPVRLHSVTDTTDIAGEYGVIDLVDLQNIDRKDVVTGQVCQACGKAAMEYIEEAVRLVLSGQARALVTAPINKEATRQAGYGEVGHLEYLAALTNAKEYATMLVSGQLRVVHLTTHYSLKEACSLVTRENILARLRLTHDSFLNWGISKPRIAVAALNPHGGE